MRPVFGKIVVALAILCTSCLGALAQEQSGRQPGQGLKRLSAFVIKPTGGQAGILVLGSAHTFDPADSEVAEIEDQVSLFKPTTILVEGGRWPVAATRQEAVRKYGEMGFAYWLASAKGIPVSDADPN